MFIVFKLDTAEVIDIKATPGLSADEQPILGIIETPGMTPGQTEEINAELPDWKVVNSQLKNRTSRLDWQELVPDEGEFVDTEGDVAYAVRKANYTGTDVNEARAVVYQKMYAESAEPPSLERYERLRVRWIKTLRTELSRFPAAKQLLWALRYSCWGTICNLLENMPAHIARALVQSPRMRESDKRTLSRIRA